MNSRLKQKKGVALFMVLGVVIIVTILANIILSMMLSHGRFTQHQVGRIQAYYASLAGINLALEKIRNGDWVYLTHCTMDTPCRIKDDATAATTVEIVDQDFFVSSGNLTAVRTPISIVFCGKNQANCPYATAPTCVPPLGADFCINSSVFFTTPSTR